MAISAHGGIQLCLSSFLSIISPGVKTLTTMCFYFGTTSVATGPLKSWTTLLH
ncbi:hypothetical protein PF005_g26293 [Phytophthora fragariae]|uniref:Uncharacterized protein n=2 Tax=Phytophthora TaxID=4783 RepID=A0A6A4BMT5_9STRA|nr:hypothetical protein PF003_g14632 [Phytophthora fragariae]KAE8985411.1 hypothetical protein PR001_g22895 [Phytophthora rubi]KAE8922488.1 hypothetical protein PF009_g27248 [Phytophthora fragariae]KAE8973521.1 hypothetical protein PF011_g25217 [Phytophthora fragariae]KAE8998161.1 hypothetical protein PR002_g18812 [Phytophthora rubi]